MMSRSRVVSWSSLAGGFLCIVLALTVGGVLGALLTAVAVMAFLMSVLAWKFGHLLLPALTQGLKIVEIRNGFEIPPSQDVIVRKIEGVWYASVYLGVNIFESVTEKSAEQKSLFMEYFERALASTKVAAKFSTLVYVKDLSSYREKIETKRNVEEINLGKLKGQKKQDLAAISKTERAIASYNAHLHRLASGEKPMDILYYVMTTAQGTSREQAIDKAKIQGKELKSTLANALNVEVYSLTGEDMKRCFEWEYTLPVSQQELEEQTF